MKLYCPSNNFKLEKVLFGSRILGKKLVHVEVPFDHKNKQFIAQYPNFSLPALEFENGQYIFGADSILLALWEEKLNSLSNFEQSQIHQWLQMAEKQLQNFTGLLVVNKQSLSEVSEQQVTKARQNIQKVMKQLDQRLKLRTYLVSHSITPADVVFFFNFRVVQSEFQKQLKNLTNLRRWMSNLESISAQLL